MSSSHPVERRVVPVLTLAFVAALVLAGCSKRAGEPAAAEPAAVKPVAAEPAAAEPAAAEPVAVAQLEVTYYYLPG